MREEALRHQVVGLKCTVDVTTVNTNGDAHEHVLRSLGDFPVDFQKVGTFERFEPKVLVVEVAFVDDRRVKGDGVLHNDFIGLVRDRASIMPASSPFFGLTMQKLDAENGNLYVKRTVFMKSPMTCEKLLLISLPRISSRQKSLLGRCR